jgi:hypothetical protein
MPADGNFSPGRAAGIEKDRQLAATGVPWMTTADAKSSARSGQPVQDRHRRGAVGVHVGQHVAEERALAELQDRETLSG